MSATTMTTTTVCRVTVTLAEVRGDLLALADRLETEGRCPTPMECAQHTAWILTEMAR